MIIEPRRVITSETRRACNPISHWEARVQGVGTRFDGRTKAEAVGRCVLGFPSFGTAATVQVYELDTRDNRAMKGGGS